MTQPVMPSAPTGLARFVPGLSRLGNVQPGVLRADVVAGLTLAAYLIPAGLADASLAGLPPEAGLYACLFAGMVFWLFCSSNHTTITVTSAISLLVGASLSDLAAGDAARLSALAAATALLVGIIALVAWLLNAGVIANFISESVLVGFKCGVALFIASTQLPKAFGFTAEHGDFWNRSRHFFSQLDQTNGTALALSVTAFAILMLCRRFANKLPAALLVVIGGIAAGSWLDLSDRGVKLMGDVPAGLPSLGLPSVNLSDVNEILPLALACFLLAAVETAAIGRMFAAKHGYRFHANQEFLGLAVGNLMAGLGRGFPVSGGMSQSLVNEGAGARTSRSGLIAIVPILMVLLFFSGSLRNLPQPVLAAIVLTAVVGLFNVPALVHLWRADRAEFAVAAAALLGVLGSGLLRGVLIGAIISLVQLLRRAARPHVAFLGRIPGTNRFSDLMRHADNEPIRGAVLFRVEGSLLYFNADHVRDTVLRQVEQADPRPAIVIADLSSSPHIDLAGAQMLITLHDELRTAGAALRVVEAHATVRDRLRHAGLERLVGSIDRFRSLEDALAEHAASHGG